MPEMPHSDIPLSRSSSEELPPCPSARLRSASLSPIAIPRHSVNADPVTDTPHRVGQIVKIEPGVTKCEAMKDVKPAIARQPEPEPTANGHDNFKSLLLAYSRAVVDSTIDHLPNQAQSLEDAITSAKVKVVGYHKTIVQDLELDVEVGKVQNGLLLDTIIELEEEIVTDKEVKDQTQKLLVVLKREVLEERLEKEKCKSEMERYKAQVEDYRAGMEMYKKEWEADADIRKEYEAAKAEKSRKKQKRVEIWEKAENVKLGV